MLQFDRYAVLTFDCYGTLIDWEPGILAAMRPLLSSYGVMVGDEEVLQTFAELEAQSEAGDYISYREVLRQVVAGFGRRFGFTPAEFELSTLASSIGSWRPFPDTAEALRVWRERYRLAVVSNIDDELYAVSAQHFPVELDWVVTAEQARAYKPAAAIFRYALGKMDVEPGRILHVAQSVYHDIAPAAKLGLATVWVNRRQGKTGAGATLAAKGRADLEVKDLATLVSVMGRA